ncbi:MAG: preprotein translocase subunit SecA [Mycoplasmataceae bacterium]|nr:preprotein translocase subunit SecA [Mycoplasmataceae bacterium]
MLKQRGLYKLNIFAPWRRLLKKAWVIANKTEALKDKYRNMSNKDLSNMTNIFLNDLQQGKTLDDIMPDAFAVAREACYRVHKLFAYKVQIVGAAIVHFGDFAEMYTGEGKTLTIVIVGYLNALSKKGIHIVTVNEYLVQRDAKFCAQALNPLSITVGYNISSLKPEEKRKMFACDITYTTNSELGFDYLRDNMVQNYEDKVIRDLNFAIVDEGDSILIDEARTPLIISGQPKRDVSMYIEVDQFSKTLKPEDYKIDPESNSIVLTDSGVKKAEVRYKLKKLYAIENSDLVHKIKNALMANYIFELGVEYIVRDNKILLVDQFTGRILEGRSYNAGLHQAIQAKEYVKIEPENVIVATITYQSFFRLYRKLAGVSGTAMTEAEEFLKIYNMVVVPIPTNKPNIRKDHNDYVFANKISKWHHVVAEIEKVHVTGQPILVGTASVEDSEQLVNYLKNKGLRFELLNAKNHAREADIVAQAGQKGAITISTNMAGRGTDIKLGPGVAELGGLYVIGTERHESRRVDNQLRGRSGRQGDNGNTRFFISLQDTLFRRFATEKLDKSEEKIDNDYFDSWFFTRLLNSTQKKVEGLNFDTRKNLIDYDSVLSNQRELVYKQRDQILKNVDNVKILKNMASVVAKDIVSLFKLPSNETYVDATKLTQAINARVLNANLLSPDIFDNKTVIDAIKIFTKILELSIDTRVKMIGDNAKNIIKTMMIQNLDFQWTNHLDRITRVREGVSLRSLEQRSPLNIYVEEADWHFNEMRKNVAHQIIISFHRLYIPKINEELHNNLAKVLPERQLDAPKKIENQDITNILNTRPNFKIDASPKLPKDRPYVSPDQKASDAKEQLLEKMHQAQNANKLNDDKK